MNTAYAYPLAIMSLEPESIWSVATVELEHGTTVPPKWVMRFKQDCKYYSEMTLSQVPFREILQISEVGGRKGMQSRHGWRTTPSKDRTETAQRSSYQVIASLRTRITNDLWGAMTQILAIFWLLTSWLVKLDNLTSKSHIFV